jgi:hypothetical protein
MFLRVLQCNHCNGKLKLGSYASLEGKVHVCVCVCVCVCVV